MAFLFGAAPMVLNAQSATYSSAAAVSSQLIDRGQAITTNTPILQGAISWNTPSKWSANLSASTEARAPSRLIAALAQVARYWPLSDKWQMQANLLYYYYPRRTGWTGFNRTETGLNWTYRDVLTMGLSAIYPAHAGKHHPRGAADVDLDWPLVRHLSFSIGAGVAQSLDSYHERYEYHQPDIFSYGHVGVIWSHGPWQVEVEHILSSQTVYNSATVSVSPWVVTISRSF